MEWKQCGCEVRDSYRQNKGFFFLVIYGRETAAISRHNCVVTLAALT